MNAESWGFVVYFKPDRLLSADIREKRDMLIFYLWKNAGMGNRQIGEVFGLTYSSVSEIVTSFGKGYTKMVIWKKHEALLQISRFDPRHRDPRHFDATQ